MNLSCRSVQPCLAEENESGKKSLPTKERKSFGKTGIKRRINSGEILWT
jgi:hypothetical protein